MTPLERALAVAIVAGTVLGALVRAALVLVLVVLATIGLLLLMLVGATRTGRQAEYHSRPW
jgi:hypothetical protein